MFTVKAMHACIWNISSSKDLQFLTQLCLPISEGSTRIAALMEVLSRSSSYEYMGYKNALAIHY
jgi:hypothetical protein